MKNNTNNTTSVETGTFSVSNSHCTRCGKMYNIFENPESSDATLVCQCQPEPATTFRFHSPAPAPAPVPLQGWQCPVCQKVHAPFVSSCTCHSPDWGKVHVWSNHPGISTVNPTIR